MKIQNRGMNAALIGLMLISMLIGISIAGLVEIKPSIRIRTTVKETIIFKEAQKEFSEDLLKEYILELNLRFPEVVLAQAKLESGNFTSRAFREQNNLFGMHVARSRPT
jgi:uncharacterized FlgJ-related protein